MLAKVVAGVVPDRVSVIIRNPGTYCSGLEDKCHIADKPAGVFVGAGGPIKLFLEVEEPSGKVGR